VKDLETDVHHFDVLSFPNRTIGIRRGTREIGTTVAGLGQAGPCMYRSGNSWRIRLRLPEAALNHWIWCTFVSQRYAWVDRWFTLLSCSPPFYWLLAKRWRQVAVYRRHNRHLADRLFSLLSRGGGTACVWLGRGIRKCAKANQRQKDAGKDDNESD